MANNIEGPLYYERMGRTGPGDGLRHPNPMDSQCWIFLCYVHSSLHRRFDVAGLRPLAEGRKGVADDERRPGLLGAIDDRRTRTRSGGLSVGLGDHRYMHHIRRPRRRRLILSGTDTIRPRRSPSRIADYKKYGSTSAGATPRRF